MECVHLIRLSGQEHGVSLDNLHSTKKSCPVLLFLFFAANFWWGGGELRVVASPPPPVCAYVQQFPLSTLGKHSPIYTPSKKAKKTLRHPLAKLKLPDQARSQRAFFIREGE